MSVYELNTSTLPMPQIEGRKGEGKMADPELQRIMKTLVEDAETMIDGELSPERQKASAYYKGELFGNEEEGRSQVILTEVRDVVHSLLPSLLRIFFGPERVVEFTARTPDRIAAAEQATDFIQYLFTEENNGFLQTYSVLKDGLVRKLGIIKWWWEPEQKRAYSDTLPIEEANELLGRDDVELTSVTDNKDATVDIEYTVTTEGRIRTEPVPPEEFLFDRHAKSIESALFVGHRTKLRRGDLIAMGYDADIIDEHGGVASDLDYNVEAIERFEAQNAVPGSEADAGEANELIEYIEGYPRIDVDGDGTPELRKVCMIGPDHYVVHSEPADERPFAGFCPIPEPHVLIGQSEADLTMDLQLSKSMIARSMLDSLALSIFPRMGFLEQFVSVEDVLSTEIGAPIRMRKENALQPISHPFTGEAAMPVLEWFDGVGESRVGRAKGAMGLDADSLQSSTLEGVTAALAASQEQVELIARVFAEQFMKPLFRGLYRLYVKYRPKARLARLRGQYVKIDTAFWEADLDCTVNVALGTSLPAKRIAALENIAGKQEAMLQMFGPGPQNPVTSLAQYRNTLARITELNGFKNPTEFWKPVDPNWAPPPAPPQTSPEQAVAQAQLEIEHMKTQKDLEIQQAKLTLHQQQQEFDQELAIRKMAMDFTLRRYQIDAQFKTNYTQANLEADAAQEEAALEGAMNVARMSHEHAMAQRQQAQAEQGQAHEQALAADQQGHDQQMAERQADTQDAAAQQNTEAPAGDGE